MDQPGGTVVAVFRDHDAAERAVRRLHSEGFDMHNLSIVGRDFRASDKPAGFISTRDCVDKGTEIGAFLGGIFGLCVGMGFLILPGLGLVIAAGPIAAALLGEMEGTAGGAVVGGLAAALVSWGVPRFHAGNYQAHVVSGKFLVIVRGSPQAIEHAKSVLKSESPDVLDGYEAPAQQKTATGR